MDVLLNPAMGEGFGITVLEAQACGTPAIVTDFSAMKEVCGAGWHVKYQPHWTGQNSWQASPDVDDIVSALEDCYALPPGQRLKLSQSAQRHACGVRAEPGVREHMLAGVAGG
jgi:glycosyltransferase involved in cell wall biosynthesis